MLLDRERNKKRINKWSPPFKIFLTIIFRQYFRRDKYQINLQLNLVFFLIFLLYSCRAGHRFNYFITSRIVYRANYLFIPPSLVFICSLYRFPSFYLHIFCLIIFVHSLFSLNVFLYFLCIHSISFYIPLAISFPPFSFSLCLKFLF